MKWITRKNSKVALPVVGLSEGSWIRKRNSGSSQKNSFSKRPEAIFSNT